MARLVVATAAAVAVAYVTGSPIAGFQTFAAVYGVTGFLDPKQHGFGSKLNDLKAPQASYGSPIPYVEGAPRLAGIYFWASDKKEIATTQDAGGKGGPGVDNTTYTYEIDCLIGLSSNVCAGVRRIWSNGKLVWTMASDAGDESLTASAITTSWRDVRFYTGAPSQLPDSTYEAAVGIGNAPAYRGRSTIFIEGLNLGSSGQLPVLTFEVCSEWVAGFTEPDTLFRADFDQLDATDTSWYATNGTLVGGAVFSATIGATIPEDPGWIARTDLVSSASNYIRFDGAQINRIVTGAAVTLEGFTGWKSLSTFTAPIAALRSTGRSHFLYWNGTTGKISFGIGGSLLIVSSLAISAGQQAHFALVYPTGSPCIVRLYVNGILQGSVSVSAVTMLSGSLSVGDNSGIGISDRWWVAGVKLTLGEVYTGPSFTPPTQLPLADVAESTAQLSDIPLDQAVSRLCLRTGQLVVTDLDVTALSTKTLRAMAISQVGPARATLEMLMGAYLFEFSEGAKLTAVLRGGAPALTIPFAAFGAGQTQDAQPLPKKRLNDIEIPAQITVKYANVLNDFQDGAETGDRLTTNSTAVSMIELPLGFTPIEAKRLADANTMDLAVSLLQIGPVALARKYAAIQPTDVLLLVDADGSTFRTRVVKATVGSGIFTFDLVLDDATVINSQVATDSSGYSGSVLVRALSTTDDELLDIPILRDADNDQGFYVAAKADGSRWPGAAFYSSRDNLTYVRETAITEQAVFGPCTSILGDWTGHRVFDHKNTLTVNVGDGALSSANRADLLNDQSVNAFAVGVDGRWELGQFRTAALLSPGVYLLSGFLRGSRGTEWAMTGHGAGEVFVALTTAGMRRILVDTSALGLARFYKAVTFGLSLAGTLPSTLTDTGVGLKPFSPFDGRVARDATTGDITLTWQRRTRLAVRTIGLMGISIPLGEESEAYSIDVFVDNTYAVVKRTLTSASPSVAYTSAMQVSDFGSNQAVVYIKMYQLSAVVGRGTELKVAA